MKIKSAEFIKGIVDDVPELHDNIPQVAFVGRSNVGKSSVINSLIGMPLARSSDTPGKTREINLYLINKDFYLVDLPGYGFAKASLQERDEIRQLILWYLLFSNLDHKIIVLIIDANVGPSAQDLAMIRRLKERGKKMIIVANKIDKIKKSTLLGSLSKLKKQLGPDVLPYSAKEKIGIGELTRAIT